MRIAVSGPIGCGKSTVVRKVMAALGPTRCAGFRTYSAPAQGGQRALLLESLLGERRVFASGPAKTARETLALQTGSPPDAKAWRARVSRAVRCPAAFPLQLHLDIFNDFGVRILRQMPPDAVVVLDELGVLEQSAEAFVREVARVFQPRPCILAVVQQRALAFWSRHIGPANIDRTILVTPANRNALPAEIVGMLGCRGKEARQQDGARCPTRDAG